MSVQRGGPLWTWRHLATSKQVDGSIDCSHIGFGDPSRQQAKECHCKQASQPQDESLPTFVRGEGGVVDGCPSGYSGIFAEATCLQAATYLELEHRTKSKSDSWSNDYPGCWYHAEDQALADFSTHPSPDGTRHDNHAGQICMLEAPTTEAPSN